MKILNFFRKPYLSVITLISFLAFSCASQEEIQDKSLTAKELAALHLDIKNTHSTSSPNGRVQEDFDWNEISPEFETNLEYVNQNGVDALFALHGFNTEIVQQFEMFNANSDNGDVYEILAQNFEFSDIEDALRLFELIEVNQSLETELANGRIQGGFSCGLAIASTIVVTAGAVTIAAGTGGAGAALAFWLVGKALATVSVIDSCSDL